MQSEGTQTLGGDRRGKRAAVMVADMVEFSRRMEQDQVGSADQVTRSIQLFRNLIGDYGGRVANITGDGILALFDSAGQALRFAIQIQTEFREQSVWGDGEPIEFRIGLNIGEVTLQESVAYGHCINVAARLQALADPSSILVSGAFRTAMGELPGTLLRSLGQPRLKNISEPIEVFEVEHSGAKHRASLARSASDCRPNPSAIRRSRSCRSPICRAIRATTISARASPRTSSPASPGSAT